MDFRPSLKPLTSFRDPSLNFLANLALQYKKGIITSSILGILSNAALLLSPYFATELTAELDKSSNESSSVRWIFLGWMFVFFLQGITAFWNARQSSFLSITVFTRLKQEIFANSIRLQQQQLEKTATGKIISILNNDSSVISQFITKTLPATPSQILILLVAIFMLVFSNIFNGILILLVVILVTLISKVLGKSIRQLGKQSLTTNAELTAIAEENLSMSVTVKSYNLEQKVIEQYNNVMNSLRRILKKFHNLQSSISPIVNTIGGLAVLGVLWILSKQYINGEIELSKFVGTLFWGFLLIRPLSTLTGLWGNFQHALSAAERTVNHFKLPSEPLTLKQDNTKIFNLPGYSTSYTPDAVVFDNVYFSYDNSISVFKGLSLAFKTKETTVITGPNGKGKSTIAKLLLKLEHHQRGNISIFGKDINGIPLNQLRDSISYVPQHTQLFTGTARENICLSCSSSSNSVEDLAIKLGLGDLEKSLTNGFDTNIGYNGHALSGGQMQKLSILRAAYKNPAILLLDEATSMFDPEAERQFILHCKSQFKDITVILITHRESTKTLADSIVEL